jgi:hypothetical protein
MTSLLLVISIAGYDIQVALGIISSTGLAGSIILQAIFVAIPLVGCTVGTIVCTLLLFLRFTRGLVVIHGVETISRLTPIFVGLLVVSLFVTPWPLVAMLGAAALPTAAMFVAFLKEARNEMDESGPIRIDAREAIDESRKVWQTWTVVWLIISTIVFNTWIPFEALTPSGGPTFTGQVVGIQKDDLVVVTAGPNVNLVRYSADTTKRSLCAHRKFNSRIWPNSGWGIKYEALLYKRSLLQLALGIRGAQLPPCPRRNGP